MELLRNFMLILILGVFFIHLVGAAVEISISVDEVFHVDEEVKFAYRFMSSQDETVKYYANILCADSPEALIEMKVADLVANEYFQEIYVYGVVNENINSGECKAIVSILEPYQKIFEKSFKIINLEFFSFNLNLNKKVFILGEEVNLDYSSEIENPSLISTLTYPDKTTQQITLPFSFTAEQIGTYALDVTASKEGYKTITKQEQFAVITEEPEISRFIPMASSFKGDSGKISYAIYILIGIVILIMTGLIILIIFLRRKNNLEGSYSNNKINSNSE